MKEIYLQWIDSRLDLSECFFVYIDKNNRYRFNHWEDEGNYEKNTRENHGLEDSKNYKQAKFKLTLIY